MGCKNIPPVWFREGFSLWHVWNGSAKHDSATFPHPPHLNPQHQLRSKHHATKHHREPEGRTNRGEMKNTTLGGFATLVLKVHVFGGLDLDLEIQRIPSGLTDSQSPKMWRSCWSICCLIRSFIARAKVNEVPDLLGRDQSPGVSSELDRIVICFTTGK